MRFTRRTPALLALALLALSALAFSACSHKIGDACHTNIDCSTLGDRVCDIASPQGYCTTDGCDPVNPLCPDDAVCVRFYTLRRGDSPCTYKGPSQLCNPTREQCCPTGEICLCGDGTNGTSCVGQAFC